MGDDGVEATQRQSQRVTLSLSVCSTSEYKSNAALVREQRHPDWKLHMGRWNVCIRESGY